MSAANVTLDILVHAWTGMPRSISDRPTVVRDLMLHPTLNCSDDAIGVSGSDLRPESGDERKSIVGDLDTCRSPLLREKRQGRWFSKPAVSY
jgi:hypothetical protein